MKKLVTFVMLVLFLAFQYTFAQNTAEQTRQIPVNPDIKIGTLPNGLKYYIKYNKKPEKKVELRLAVNAGAILEDDSQQGLAHFMEHMNFNGLKNFPNNELVHYLQSIGVAFGNDLNAYTGFEETVYILPFPSDKQGKIDSSFMVIADWSGNSLLTAEEIDKERGVILAESRLGKGADDRMMKKWLPAMLNGSKYADRLPIGKDSIIEHFDHSVLKQFYKDWYRPSLQAVIVVGDMPVDQAEKMIIKNFGGFKNPDKIRERPERFDVKPYTASRAMVLSDPEADRTSINISGSSNPRKALTTEGDYLGYLSESLFSIMLNARLEELKNSENPPFVYAYTYIGGGWARGYESFNAGAMCGSSGMDKAVTAMVVETMRAKKFGFTQAELDRAKASMVSNYETQYNERDKTESERLTYEIVNNYFTKDAIPGIAWEYNFVKNNINAISLKDFDKLREKIDIDNKYFAFITSKAQPGLPTDDQFKGWIDAALKQPVEAYKENKVASTLLEKEPVAGKIVKTEKNAKLGTTTYTLSNKAVVCIKPTDFKNDEILLKGSRFGGFSIYPGTDYQSGQWCNNVVDEMGYGAFSSTDLAKFLSGKAVKMAPTVVEYTESMDGSSGIKDMETMFQLLYLKSTSPRKDDVAFKSFINRQKQQLESIKQNPQYLFMDTAYNTFYQGNARAHMVESTADYDKINIDRAISFYKERIGNAAGMYYTIIGSFKEEQIKPLIEKYIASLPSGEINTKIKDIGLFPKQGTGEFTLHKGSEPQAMLMHYINGKMPYNADDNFMLRQANAVLNNWIIDTIREKMSAIYGGGCGGSLLKYPREEFLIQSYFPCSPDNLENVHTAFLGLIESLKKTGGITENDWKKVREPALEHYKEDIKKNDYWMNSLQSSFLNSTDPERILTVEQRLNGIKIEQLTAIAKKFYSTPNLFKAKWLPEK
jgi:zinc protease